MPDSCLPWLSVVIPVWRDLEGARQRITEIHAFDSGIEVLVAGLASEIDPTTNLAHGQIIRSGTRGRGHQIAAAIEVARGEALLIQHADNPLASAHLEALRRALTNPEVLAGAYYRDFAENWPALSVFEPLTRWWARSWAPLYGDQSMFIRRGLLEELGGFPDIPLMEDVELGWRIRGRCQPLLLDPPMCASMRRFERRGRLKNRLENCFLLLRYALGDSPFRLFKKYYGPG